MIIVVGVPSEEPVSRVIEEAEQLGVPTVVLDESEAADWDLRLDSGPAGLGVHARTGRGSPRGSSIDLTAATGLYLRLTSPRQGGPSPDQLRAQRAEAAISLICAWSDIAPIRVANRPTDMASNASKPYQAALIRRRGFGVPATLVTNDPDAVRDFQRAHGRLIYKSTSGVRSIVHELTPARTALLDRVRNLPTQFQQLLDGTNIRVHVIGLEVFACEIDAETIDYRYREGGTGAQMRPVDLPNDVRERCLALSADLRLPLAGIDLFRDTHDQWWCFEVNPSPAYSCFEEPTGLPMAAALSRWLAG